VKNCINYSFDIKYINYSICKIHTIWYLAFLIIINGCAKVGSPTGGPRDVTPPKVTYSNPLNYSTEINTKDIEIVFDEYLTLDNIQNELFISPPPQNRPSVRLRNKSILITLNDELLPNTTYNFNFGNAIRDLNEGNVLTGFEFVFSTGDRLDSLSVTGTALGAFDRKPPLANESVLVMLYSNLADSAPLLELPRYMGKVNIDGLFNINHIREDSFRIIVLKDVNGNNQYDPITDAIAFSDSFTYLSPSTVEEIHLITDTINLTERIIHASNFDFSYFHEISDKVFLNSRERSSPEKLTFIFSRPPHDTVSIEGINIDTTDYWYIPEYSNFMDTITWWITDSTIYSQDSLSIILSYLNADDSGKMFTQFDTMSMIYRDTEMLPERMKAVIESNNLSVIANIRSGAGIPVNSAITFTASRPVQEIYPDKILLYNVNDSLQTQQGS